MTQRCRTGAGTSAPALFAGGCVATQMTAPVAYRADLITGVPLILGLTSRQTLQEALEQRSNGRLHLDPTGAR